MKNVRSFDSLSLFVLLLLLFLSGQLLGQEDGVQVNLPVSPEAAAFGKFGDIPVGEFTGSAQVSVPIYNMNYRGVSIPISLSYHSNGIRVAEEASWVGLGWSLNAGGRVTRAVRGYDDFGTLRVEPGCSGGPKYYTNYWTYVNGPNASDLTGFHSQGEMLGSEGYLQAAIPYIDLNNNVSITYDFNGQTFNWDYFCRQDQNVIDFESDLYTYNILGYSGKFIIGNDGGITFLEANDLQVSVDVFGYDDVRWHFITPEGISVYVGTARSDRQLTYSNTRATSEINGAGVAPDFFSIPCNETPDSYISTWFVDKVVLPSGEEIIFSNQFAANDKVYSVPSFSNSIKNRIAIEGDANGSGPVSSEQRTVTLISYDNIYLQSISNPFTGEEVVFNASGGRQDLIGGLKLDDITVKKNGYNFQRYEFSYDYFTSPSTSLDERWEDDFYGALDGYNQLVDANNNPIIEFTTSGMISYTFTDGLIGKRLKLLSMQQIGTDGGSDIPPYTFKYHDNLPVKTSYAVDHWGFYNGAHNNRSFVPNADPIDIGVSGTSCFTQFAQADEPYTDKEAHFPFSQAGLLYSVKYPTGGSTELTYEGHKYPTAQPYVLSGSTQESIFLVSQGYCISSTAPTPKTFVFDDNNPNVNSCAIVNLRWQIESCAEGGCSGSEPCIGINGESSNEPLLGFLFIIKDQSGQIVESWSWDQAQGGLSGAPSPDGFSVGSFHADLTEGQTYTMEIKNLVNGNTIPWNVFEASMSISWPQYQQRSEAEGAGVRIASVVSTTEIEQVGMSKSYKYEDEYGNSTGSVLNEPVYSYISNEINNLVRQIGNSNTYVSSNTNTIYLNRFSNSVVPLSNSYSGSFIGYDQVKVEHGDAAGNGYQIKEFYQDLPSQLPSGTSVYGLPRFYNQRNGSPLSEKTFTVTGELVHEMSYTYNADWGGWNSNLTATDSRFDPQWGYRVTSSKYVTTSNSGVGIAQDFVCWEGFWGPEVFVYADVPQWHYLESVTETTYGDETGAFTVAKSYVYEPGHFQLRSQNIAGKQTTFHYPFDLGTEYDCLELAHMVGIPVKIDAPDGITYQTEYNCSYLVPDKFLHNYSNGTSSTRTHVKTFLSPYGYPQTVRTFGNVSDEVYFWNQGLVEHKEFQDWDWYWQYDNLRRLEVITDFDGLQTTHTYTPSEVVWESSYFLA